MATGKKVKQQKESLARFLNYVLGLRPDEFGLVPDEEGWIPIKELLQALSEEEGWRGVREGNIRELLRDPDLNGLEQNENMIRCAPAETQLTYGPYQQAQPPKLLYCAVRRKGYPVILENGLRATSRPFLSLALTREMALRLGRRRDSEPVLLTVQAEKAHDRGLIFYRPQELIYLVERCGQGFVHGTAPAQGKTGNREKNQGRTGPGESQPWFLLPRL